MVAALEDFIEANSEPCCCSGIIACLQFVNKLTGSGSAGCHLDFNPEQSLRFGADAPVAEVARTAQTALPRDCAVWSDCGSRSDSDSSLPGCRIAWELLRDH